uniref:Endoplasmic reticulum resident protein 29 C-terminal domain-containing protein n=1 Tax=Dendroctonus ponderosae TaxID=77166 RepID=J3JXX7_DENPD|nr:unknown [Dendroctonus ponderosae]
MLTKLVFLAFAVICAFLFKSSEAHVKGSVLLDEYNFDRVISRFETVLVKFDAVYPFGEKHDAFRKVAEEFIDSDELLIVTIGIKDFGEHDNQKLAERFGIVKKRDWPALRLFVKGQDEPFSLNSTHTWNENEIKKFIRENTNVYLGLPGCLEEFDKIAVEFATSFDKVGILQKAEEKAEALENEEQKKVAKTYIKFMGKALDKETFLEDERKRLNKILREGKVKAEKKENMQLRANILTAFIPPKDEL